MGACCLGVATRYWPGAYSRWHEGKVEKVPGFSREIICNWHAHEATGSYLMVLNGPGCGLVWAKGVHGMIFEHASSCPAVVAAVVTRLHMMRIMSRAVHVIDGVGGKQ